MFRRISFVLLAFLFSVAARGDSSPSSLKLDLRFRSPTTETSAFDESLYFSFDWLAPVTTELAVRLSQTGINLKSFEYKADFSIQPVSFVTIALRLAHASYRDFGGSKTTVFPTITLSGRPLHALRLYGTIGWYERFIRVSGANVLPAFSRALPDRDLAGRIGFEIFLPQSFSLETELSTFERISVFNLNNPFVQSTLNYQPPGSEWHLSLFGRYQILLGFGRLDEWMVGLGIEAPFGG